MEVDYEEILLEWSYRLPNGFPTVVDGVLGQRDELVILNQILQERGLSELQFQLEPEVLKEEDLVEGPVSLGTDPTDTKEALVCMFLDAQLSNSITIPTYRKLLDRSLDAKTRKQLISTLTKILTNTIGKYAKNYNSPGIVKAPQWLAVTLSDVSTKNGDIITASNAVAAADAIIGQFGGLIKAGSCRRDASFNAIRKHATTLMESNYNIRNYLADNWCPGDIYLIVDPSKVNEALKSTELNIGAKALNNYFYGSNNKKGPFIAVSLKMQMAQAGKGTTFLKNVVVDGVTAEDKGGEAAETKALIKFRNTKRRLDKYYITSDAWKKDAVVFEKVRAAIAALNMPGAPTNIADVAKLRTFLAKNKPAIQQTIVKLDRKLSKSLDVVSSFQQAYTKFITELRSKNISKIKGDALTFIKAIEQANRTSNGGKLNLVLYNEMLAQKAATYKLASTLIEKWTEKTKKVAPGFAAHLEKVKNPFVAITLYAIAQHGLNPNFYKVMGKDSGAIGSVAEFPSNSQVDEKKSADNLEIKDSPSAAGFQVIYLLAINKHTYKTTLAFRFASSQIRVEVQRLESVG